MKQHVHHLHQVFLTFADNPPMGTYMPFYGLSLRKKKCMYAMHPFQSLISYQILRFWIITYTKISRIHIHLHTATHHSIHISSNT